MINRQLMKRWHYFTIFTIGLLLRVAVGLLQNSPGFMDAEYYFTGGRNIVQGYGFSEQILWNYLDEPVGIPHPSHAYWMPLASILAAIGMLIARSQDFAAAQSVFILLSSLLPPLTAYLCFLLTNNRASALLAGGIAILSGFYLPFMTTSDTFGIYALLGTSFFVVLSEPHISRRYLAPITLGVITGLMHLSRTDGIIWLWFASLGVLASNNLKHQPATRKISIHFEGLILMICGYLAIMGPWFMRNLMVFGSLLGPGGSRSLWIIGYDETFIYPASQLTLERWLSSGLKTILEARSWALGVNLQRSIAEQGLIFLFPLIIIGVWQFRKDHRMRLGVLAWLCTFFIMTFIFPYQGARGGFFHSSAALVPLLWCAGAIGFDAALQWAHHYRSWNIREARIVFSIAILFFTLSLTVFNGWTKFARDDQAPSKWETNHNIYQQVDKEIKEAGAQQQEIILTINPPGYFASTGRRAIAIPDGKIQTTLEVAEKYGARYLVLEQDHPKGLGELYENPQMKINGLEYLTTIANTYLFVIH